MSYDQFLKLANEARTRIKEVTPAETLTLIAEGAIVIDVRDDNEFATGHIPGAIHISRDTLEGRIAGIAADRDTPIICYCTLGLRSALAADTLQHLGYRNVTSLGGGLKAYQASSATRKIA